MLYNYQNELKLIEFELKELNLDPGLTAVSLSSIKNARERRRIPQNVRCMLERRADLDATCRRLQYLLESCYVFQAESASEGEVKVSPQVTQNFTDVVGATTHTDDSGISDVPMGMHHKLPLDDFFARPISIASFEEKVDGEFSDALAVWALYTGHPSVRAKLRNYSFLKADLMVMFTVSGTPFHYGKALISYQAYAQVNSPLTGLVASVGVEPTLRPLLLNYLSQAPGATTIDYNGNRPVLIRCPFISPKPMHRLYNGDTTVISAATAFEDLEVAGDVYFYSINPVKAATATPTPVGVHIYAWMENVELGPPTGTQIEITTESGDERKTGPVEKVSSALVKVSNALSVIPEIAPFAKASSMFFGGLNLLSSVMGWSRPLVQDETKFVKNRPYTNPSFGIVHDTAEKISLDPHQELSVDPRVCGIRDDEMSIQYLTGVETYLTTFSWDEGDEIGIPIWACFVHPQLETFDVTLVPEIYQPTALSFAVTPFAFWRGTVKYRLEIVCSHFHRGKFLIRFEPNAEQYDLIEADSSLNKQYIKVIDIQETQDVEFCVKYAQPYTWCKTFEAPVQSRLYGSGISIADIGETITNGFISIRPFTNLQSPDLSSIYVNVYVSGEDIQVNSLVNTNLPLERLTVEAESASGASPEIGYTCFELNEVSDTADGCTELCFGEQPLSFRICLKRYMEQQASVHTLGATAHKSLNFTRDNIPRPRPEMNATSTVTNLLSYLQFAYLGLKGSMRSRYHVWVQGAETTSSQSLVVSLRTPGNTDISSLAPSTQTGGAALSMNGGITFAPHTNAGVEVEIPFYSPNLFSFAFSSPSWTGGLENGIMQDTWFRQHNVWLDSSAVSTDVVIVREIAIGEDFQLLRFNGAPFYTRTA
jgi:hypothetical protein